MCIIEKSQAQARRTDSVEGFAPIRLCGNSMEKRKLCIVPRTQLGGAGQRTLGGGELPRPSRSGIRELKRLRSRPCKDMPIVTKLWRLVHGASPWFSNDMLYECHFPQCSVSVAAGRSEVESSDSGHGPHEFHVTHARTPGEPSSTASATSTERASNAERLLCGDGAGAKATDASGGHCDGDTGSDNTAGDRGYGIGVGKRSLRPYGVSHGSHELDLPVGPFSLVLSSLENCYVPKRVSFLFLDS